jgi:hypothetical protein
VTLVRTIHQRTRKSDSLTLLELAADLAFLERVLDRERLVAGSLRSTGRKFARAEFGARKVSAPA